MSDPSGAFARAASNSACYNQSFLIFPFSLHDARSRCWSNDLNRAAAGLESIIAKSLHCSPADQSALLAWPVACGSAVADRTRALNVSEGILRVEVADKGWQRELTALAPRYVAAINRYSGTTVRRIEFVVKA